MEKEAEQHLDAARRHASALGRQVEPLLAALGTRQELLQVLGEGKDPAARAAAIQALLAQRLSSSSGPVGAEHDALVSVLERIARDSSQDPTLRGTAIAALPFVSMARAQEILPALLDDPGPHQVKVLDVLETVQFAGKTGRSGPELPRASFRAFLRDRVRRMLLDPASSPEVQSRARRLLESDPQSQSSLA